jgi:hypothetical protein
MQRRAQRTRAECELCAQRERGVGILGSGLGWGILMVERRGQASTVVIVKGEIKGYRVRFAIYSSIYI